jgi:hypothetical protein
LLAWRQFRTQAAVALGALVLLALVILITGLHLRHLYDASGLGTCGSHGYCEAEEQAFLSHGRLLQNLLGPILLAMPVVIGMFWGAPLLGRELESGTHRLAWDAEHQPHALARDQVAVGRSGRHRRGGGLQPDGDLVVGADRPRQHEPPHPQGFSTGVASSRSDMPRSRSRSE